jgi:WD40 repeat protein
VTPTSRTEGPGNDGRPAIPDYELIKRIGQGSYGDVWLARGVTGLFRAVKVVWRERFSEPQPFEREFKGLREFMAVSLIEAHQMALLHVGRNDDAGFFYYVMELADDAETGREIDPERYVPLTLREMRVRRGRLPAERCIALAAELARALAGLHARNLLHRDIKPSNVIIVGGVAKLADIGLVVSASEATTFVGTEGFVPPEGPGAPSADVYGLGKLIYELSSGRDRTDFPSLPLDLESLADRKTLLELNEIVTRACDPSPALRYADGGAMLQDILLLQAGHSVRRLHFVERRLRDSLQLAVILAAVAIVAGGGAFIERKRLAAETERRQKAEAALEEQARNAYYAATLSRAQKALESGNYGIARTALKEVPAAPGPGDPRDFEWWALWGEAQGDPATVLSESGPALVRVHYSADSKLLAAQTTSSDVTVWQAQTGREQMRLRMPHAPQFAGFSADSRWLLGVNDHFALQRWSAVDGKPEATGDKGLSRPLGSLGDDRVVIYDYKRKGTNTPDNLRIWDFSKKAQTAAWPIPHTSTGDGIFFSGAVSPDGTSCALGLIFGRARLATWRLVVMDLGTGTVLWDEAVPNPPAAMAYASDSRTLACAFGDPAELRLLDLGRLAWRWRTPILGSPLAVAYLEPGVFCVGGRGRRVQLIAADSGRVTEELRGQSGNVSDLAADPQTGQIASVSDTGELRVWSRAPRRDNSFPGFWSPSGGDRAACLSRDGGLLAATLDGHRVQIVDSGGNGRAARTIDGVLAPALFSNDQRSLWAIGLDGSVQQWELGETPRLEATVKVAQAGAALLGASGSLNGHWVVAYDSGGRLLAVDTEKKQLVSKANAGPRGLYWAAVSDDGRYVAASGVQQFVGIWTLPDLNLKSIWHSDQWVTNGAFSPDGHVLAVTLKSGTVQFHQTEDPSRVVLRTPSSGTAFGLRFHPTEPRLFVGGQDGIVQVFNTTDWSEMLQMTAADSGTNPGTIITEAASADGSTLAVYMESGLIRLWRK